MELILDLCKGHKYDWEKHIKTVVRISKILAEKLGANVEVVEKAAWLHDVSKLIGKPNKHHLTGAKQAAKILKQEGYDNEFIEKVKHCIKTHSSDKNHKPESLEAKILASADGLSHFENFEDLKVVAKNKEKGWLKEKLKKSWNKMILESKEYAKEHYPLIVEYMNSHTD